MLNKRKLKMSTFNKIEKNHLCLGCGLCETIDKANCKMVLANEGFYHPVFKEPQKIKNKIIRSVCPAINIQASNKQFHWSIWGDVVSVSNAWAKDYEIRRKSSSGGVTSALAIFLLEKKMVDAILHVGVEEDTYLYNKLLVSRTKEDVLRCNASRYAPAAVFNDILSLLEKEETFAFIGKPCDIAGMQNLLRLYPQYQNKVKYFLSIFCAGMPSYSATNKALATFGKNEEPVKLQYRGDGWPGYFTATYKDGSSCRMTYNESWGKILGRSLGFRCKICPDGIGMLADISSGDSWETKDGYPDFTEGVGRNFCFVRTTEGQNLFNEAIKAGYIEADSLNVEDVIHMQRYQYERRHMVGWRIAAVQIMTFGLLNFRGLGFVHTALQANYSKGFKDFVGTIKRLIKVRINK